MDCFICLSRKQPLIQPDCLCKTIYVHPGCYKKWLQTTCPDILTCSVCKSAVSVNFVKQFVSLEQLMIYPHKIQEPNEDGFVLRDGFLIRDFIAIPGIADNLELHNGEIHYKNSKQKDCVTESAKRLRKSERYSVQSYKKSYCF